MGFKARGDVVRRLQSLLRAQGMSLPVDGVLGRTTLNAIAAYRTARALPASSSTDDALWADLLQRSGSLLTSRIR
jgi:peptidoglycan hydrolase-like protein with peptidoglycan-binding domain